MSQTNEIYIESNGDTPVFMTAVVSEEMPYVEFSLGEQSLRLHYDFEEDDVVKVDFDKEVVFINGKEQNVTIDLLKADFFWLHTGMNDVKTVPPMQLDVKYMERWL